MTDFQRQRVYDAETSARTLFANAFERPTLTIHGSVVVVPEMRRFGSMEGVRHFVASVQAMPWYKAAYPTLTPIAVRNRKASNRAHYQGGTIAVAAERTHRLDQWAMTEPYILHEMAHHAARDGHGPAFAAALLSHLAAVMGPEARLIQEDAFHAHGVKIDYKSLV